MRTQSSRTHRRKTKVNKLQRLWFVLSSVFLFFLVAFTWGFLSARFEVFPYGIIQETVRSIEALKDLYALEAGSDRSAHEIASPSLQGGITVNKLAPDDDKYILVTLFRDDEFTAQVMDRQGRIVQAWQVPFEQQKLFSARDTGIPLSKKNLTIHGACVHDNGDLYLVIEYRGLLKLDKASNVLWAIDLPIHHAVTCDADGSVWTLSRKRVRNRKDWIPLVNHPYWEDQVLHISPDGEIIEQFSVLDVIFQNRYEGTLYGGHPGRPSVHHDDPLHVNDIDILTREQAARFPGVQAEDIMISMRTISTIFILDRKTHAIKWSMTGPFHRQHDPEISADGSLLIYDNRSAYGQRGGGAKHLIRPQDLGYSRIIAVDPATRHIVWQYQGNPEYPFYSSIQGKLEELPNRNILVVEPEGGRVFEINRSMGSIVWEFVNLVEKGFVGRVTGAIPLSEKQVGFLKTE